MSYASYDIKCHIMPELGLLIWLERHKKHQQCLYCIKYCISYLNFSYKKPINSKNYPAKSFGQNFCTNAFMNIFEMQKTWRTNIRIYSGCQKMPNEYLNIFRWKKRDEYLQIWIYSSHNIWIYSNVWIFATHCHVLNY